MAIRVIDAVTGADFTFPMLPESLEYSRFGRFEQLKLLDGDASLPTGETAGRISFSGKLPGSKRSGAYIESRRAPGEVQKTWAAWLEGKRRLRIVVGGTPIDESVYLESFKLTFAGGFGDCDYSISFLRAGSVDYGESSGSNVPHIYTVMAGDTLWDIARRTLGDGASYGAIFDANYDAIVKSGGIRPGMTITIPEAS